MFCSNCGAAVSGAFCAACGRPAGPSTPPPSPPAPVAAAKGSSLGKILLVVFSFFVLLAVLAAAGIYYATGKLKAKAIETISQAVAKDPCALLSKEEVQEILGVPIEKTAPTTGGSEPGCSFFASSEAFQKLARDSAAKIQEQAEAGAAAADKATRQIDNPLALLNNDSIKNLEGIVKTLGAVGQAVKGDGLVFDFSLDSSFGRDSWPTFRTTMSLIPGFESIGGVGDNAMVGPFGSVLYVQKGAMKVTLNLTSVPDARTKGVALARKVVSRL